MKSERLVVALSLFITPALAVDRNQLFGEWGTEKQCQRALITPKGTKHAAPFDIGSDWFGHGDVWCRLIWSTVFSTPDGLVAVARSLCGEDSVRDYQIRFELNDDALTVVWNQQHENGPLKRCTVR